MLEHYIVISWQRFAVKIEVRQCDGDKPSAPRAQAASVNRIERAEKSCASAKKLMAHHPRNANANWQSIQVPVIAVWDRPLWSKKSPEAGSFGRLAYTIRSIGSLRLRCNEASGRADHDLLIHRRICAAFWLDLT